MKAEDLESETVETQNVETSASKFETRFSGYIKTFAIAQDSVDNPVFQIDTTYQSQNSLRLMADGFDAKLAWQFHYELNPVFLSQESLVNNQTFTSSADGYRITDPDPVLGNASTRRNAYQNLDRLNVQLQFKSGDLTIGRQAITFGSSRFINPVDVFLPFDVRTFNQEYRIGVDALRFQNPLGSPGELDAGVIFGEDGDKDKSAVFVQLRTHVQETDIQTTLMRFSQQNLFGAGLETSLGNFGFWFEAADVSGVIDYLRVSTGLDYAFSEFVFGMIEYHYNEASSGNSEDYLLQFQTVPYQRGGVFLLGKNYLLSSLSLILSPLWNTDISVLLNLTDDSTFTSLKAGYNLSENIYMDLGLYHFSGDDIKASPLPPFLELGSEFGGNPDLFFLALRYYF